MARLELTPWRSYSEKQKLCTLALCGLWAYSVYKIYGVLRFGEIFPKSRFGRREWFSYADDPERYVTLVVMHGAVVAAPAVIALVIVTIRLLERRRDGAGADAPPIDARPPQPIIRGPDER